MSLSVVNLQCQIVGGEEDSVLGRVRMVQFRDERGQQAIQNDFKANKTVLIQLPPLEFRKDGGMFVVYYAQSIGEWGGRLILERKSTLHVDFDLRDTSDQVTLKFAGPAIAAPVKAEYIGSMGEAMSDDEVYPNYAYSMSCISLLYLKVSLHVDMSMLFPVYRSKS